MEVEIFELAELGAGRRKQLLDDPDVIVHRAADVEEHQELDRVAPFGPGLHVEIAVLGGGVDGAGQVELLLGALAHPAAQALQRDLDVARAELDRIVEIAELAPVPHLYRAPVAAFVLADAHAFGIVAIGAERRGARGADPFRAALVPALLFLEPLPQRLHQLLEAAECLDQLLLLVGQVLFGEPPQPFLRDIGDVDRAFARQRLDALEDMRKDLVEAVDVALVLHQRGARQVVKALDVELHQPGIHALEQRQVLAQRDRHARGLQLEEEGDEHASQSASPDS